MSISSRLLPVTFFVAGALLVPRASFAQDAIPSIVQVDGTSAPVPSAVASPSLAPTNLQPTIESLSFKDVEITQLLDIISTQFDLPIAVSGEISGKISVINLKGKTAEQALDAVIQVARLSCKKQADGTYIISKPDPSAVPEPLVVPPLPSIVQSGSSFGGNRMMNTGNSALGQIGVPTNDIALMDDGPVLKPMDNEGDAKKRRYYMHIKNIKASMMAFWLDPANNEEPIELKSSRLQENIYGQTSVQTMMMNNPAQVPSSSGGISTQPLDTRGLTPSSNPYINPNADMVQTFADPQFGQGNGNGGRGGNNNNGGGRGGGRAGGGGGVFQLPPGVDRIVAVDPQNALLVFGTPDGVRELQRTINFLDKPLRQVEIEAQFLSITTSAAKQFGLDFSTARGNFSANSSGSATANGSGSLQVGFIRGNFSAAIAAAENSGRAKTLTAPRVLAINNLTATLQQSLQTPIVLTSSVAGGGLGGAVGTTQNLGFIQTTTLLNVTPTINNDDTITVLMQPQVSTPIGTPNSVGASAISTQSLQTIANVRDGETIALGGLRTNNISLNKTKVPVLGDIPIVGKLFNSRQTSDSETELIIFLTARIIHRVGDDNPVVAGDTGITTGGQ